MHGICGVQTESNRLIKAREIMEEEDDPKLGLGFDVETERQWEIIYDPKYRERMEWDDPTID